MITIKVSDAVLQSRLEPKLTKLANKSKRLGFATPFSFRIVGEEMVNVGNSKNPQMIKANIVEIEGESGIKVDGYQFAARLDFETVEKMIVMRNPEFALAIPEFDESKFCEHCKQARKRLNMYALYEESTGRFIRVGSSCLVDFLGHSNAEKIAALYDEVYKLYHETRDNWCNDSDIRFFDTVEFLGHCAAMIRVNNGYVSRKMVEDENSNFEETTASAALNNMFPLKPELAKFVLVEDEERAAKVLSWAREYFVAPFSSDYESNMNKILQGKAITYKAIGFAASVFACYAREIEKIERQKAESKELAKSDFVGSIGDKISFSATVLKCFSFDGQFGAQYIVLFQDEKGNIFKWSTSAFSADIGTRWTIRGSIKAHEEYKGTKQTVLTRCKAEEII